MWTVLMTWVRHHYSVLPLWAKKQLLSCCFSIELSPINKPCQSLGVLASIPVIKDSDLTQADDEAIDSFNCGSLISMNNQLFHPHLLQLMAVSLSADLKTSLVFERVHVDSLHNLIHHKRLEFPVLHTEWLLPLLLQVCEGVLYLHSRGLVVRALSSHSIVLTHPGLAKLTGFGFMAHRSCASPDSVEEIQPSLQQMDTQALATGAEPVLSGAAVGHSDQEESNSDLDQSQATLEPYPMLHNPDPKEEMHPTTPSQAQKRMEMCPDQRPLVVQQEDI
ncbi:unnamed protein product [Merluccius merluccius]